MNVNYKYRIYGIIASIIAYALLLYLIYAMMTL